MIADIKKWTELSGEDRASLMRRPAVAADDDIRPEVEKIIATVREGGDAALFNLAAQLEGCDLACLKVSSQEFVNAESALSPAASAAIDTAIANVRRFHEAQLPTQIDLTISPGVRCQRLSHAIDSVGLYVPAGSAPLPSTAIMLGVPAAVAGCPIRVLCTPPQRDGFVDSATLLAARRSGITDVYKVGGAQAIAAMAYGTKTLPKVNRIFGPGNAWVTTAKRLVAAEPGGASIDMPAGPSEVLIIADDFARPEFLAADLLAQAEHGPDSQVVLITTSRDVALASIREMEKQLESLPRRSTARIALRDSHVIQARNVAEAISISNRYAPEHLILSIREPRSVLNDVRNAGSVFLGRWSPESVGDYCSGTNHVLPTYGSASSYSGLGVEHFMRHMTVQELSEAGLRSLAPSVLELASLEGLDAHAESVRLRLKRPQGQRCAQ